MYIYAGKPSSPYTDKYEIARIQLNDKFADVGDVAAFVSAERVKTSGTTKRVNHCFKSRW